MNFCDSSQKWISSFFLDKEPVIHIISFKKKKKQEMSIRALIKIQFTDNSYQVFIDHRSVDFTDHVYLCLKSISTTDTGCAMIVIDQS